MRKGRIGVSTRKYNSANADKYGVWSNGVQLTSERINGRTLTYIARPKNTTRYASNGDWR